MTFKKSQCFAVSLLALGMSVAALAQPVSAASVGHTAHEEPTHEKIVQQVQNHWAKLEERRSFNELSLNNLRALNAILEANVLLAQHNQKEARSKLDLAQQELNSALQTHHTLAQSASYIEKCHKVDPAIKWLPEYNTANWAPVGGKFIAKTTLSASEKKAMQLANLDLIAGKVDNAYKALKNFEAKTQISIAIAPLEPTIKAVRLARETLDKHDEASAQKALNGAMTHYVFIPQNALNVDVLVHKVRPNAGLIARR